MSKYLDNDGLLYLWQKLKATFATTTDLDDKVDKVTGKDYRQTTTRLLRKTSLAV